MRPAPLALPLVLPLLLLGLLGCPVAARSAPGDPVRGQSLYKALCTACHSVDHAGLGPPHRGVFGRLAGTAKGFGGYSSALKRSGLVWDEASLERWLTDPEGLVPGQAMGVSVPDAADRADLIAYLRTLTPAKE
ncbi:MAG: c-type cytochrome [Paucibacter sp.]|nr:c-type cytochrome [Roseateles sp.]